MTVGKLKEILEKYDNDLEIYIPSQIKDYDYWKVDDVDAKFITIEDSKDYPDETLVMIIGDH